MSLIFLVAVCFRGRNRGSHRVMMVFKNLLKKHLKYRLLDFLPKLWQWPITKNIIYIFVNNI